MVQYSFILIYFTRLTVPEDVGYWRQRVDDQLCSPPTKGNQKPLVVKTKSKTTR